MTRRFTAPARRKTVSGPPGLALTSPVAHRSTRSLAARLLVCRPIFRACDRAAKTSPLASSARSRPTTTELRPRRKRVNHDFDRAPGDNRGRISRAEGGPNVQRFKIEVPDSLLADLADRLARTRFPDQLEGAGATVEVR